MEKRKVRLLVMTAAAALLLSGAALGETYTVLQYKDQGTAVANLQVALNQLGYSTSGTEGKYGPATEKAVRQFQADYGLKVDGKAGSATQTLVYQLVSGGGATSASATASSGSGLFGGNYDTLKYGDRGSRVTKLQQALNSLGFSAGSADGRFGAGTQQAVTAFQRAQKLTADGKAGKATLTRLEQVLSGEVSNATPAPETPTATPAPSTGTAAVPTRTLRKGYQGDDVKSVQTQLKSLGYYTGSIDGKYGTGTMAAVSAFQQMNGLHADGLAGSATYKVLYSNAAVAAGTSAAATATPAPASATPSRILRPGYEGDDVKSVQTKLKELGYYTGSVDGKYGTGTVAAVTAFQQTNGLTADGKAGSATYKVLYSDTAKAAGSLATLEPTATPASTGAVPSRTLRSGDTGDEVKSVQTRLKALGYYTGSIDGKYGTGTVAAVMAFQRNNGLSADGVAGSGTYKVLYSDSAKDASTASSGATNSGAATSGSGPSKSQVKLMHWYNEVKPLLKGQKSIYVYDPATGYSFTLHLYSLGRHADVEPMTAQDTANMMAAFGGVETWTPKFVYVKLPNGEWTAATMHNVAHGGQSIKDNNFNGQNCVHFLRDMDECSKNDPKYGVTNQNVLRAGWKALTGETVN